MNPLNANCGCKVVDWVKLPLSLRLGFSLEGDSRSIGETGGSTISYCPLHSAAPKLFEVAQGCLGYFEYMKKQKSEFTPDEMWLTPLREVIKSIEGGLF